MSTQVKYLGVTIDHNLSWNAHIEQKTSKATKALVACSSTVEASHQRMLNGSINKSQCRVYITYTAIVWSKAINTKHALN